MRHEIVSIVDVFREEEREAQNIPTLKGQGERRTQQTKQKGSSR